MTIYKAAYFDMYRLEKIVMSLCDINNNGVHKNPVK